MSGLFEGAGWGAVKGARRVTAIIGASFPRRPLIPTMTHRSAPPRPFMRTFGLLLALLVFASGCARMSKMFKDENANEGVPVEELYEKAHAAMTQGNWSSAQTTFKRLVAQYPYGPYTEQALV